MKCKDCGESCYCAALGKNPPCGFCLDHGECIVCGGITCETVTNPLDGDEQHICDYCQFEGGEDL